MALRAFRGQFLVAIDDQEAIDNEHRESPEPVTLDELRQYISETMIIDVNTKEWGDGVGFQSAELLHDTLVELPPEEVKRLYS